MVWLRWVVFGVCSVRGVMFVVVRGVLWCGVCVCVVMCGVWCLRVFSGVVCGACCQDMCVVWHVLRAKTMETTPFFKALMLEITWENKP